MSQAGSSTAAGGSASTSSGGSASTSSGAGCKCGVEKTSRIVGGTEVNPVNKYPWMAALVRGGGQFCGGTLVASKYVISAAHCMTNSAGGIHTDPDFQIRIGEHDL